MPNGTVLGSMEGFGQVYDCGRCGNIHLQVGHVSIMLSPENYMKMVALLSTSAANFETWMEHRNLEIGEGELS